jgi:hypothetical protein
MENPETRRQKKKTYGKGFPTSELFMTSLTFDQQCMASIKKELMDDSTYSTTFTSSLHSLCN